MNDAIDEARGLWNHRFSRGSMRMRYLRYYGVNPSAHLAAPRMARAPVKSQKTSTPAELHGFTFPEPSLNQPPKVNPQFTFPESVEEPETASAPTLQGQKEVSVPYKSAESSECSTSLAFLADVHLDPESPTCAAWTCAKRFVADKQPDTVILGGDFLHMASLSHWDMSKRRLVEGRRYLAEVELANKELDELQNSCPSTQFYFLEGNHEAWVARYVDQYPEVEGMMDLEENLRLEERGIPWVPENEVLKVGKMRYLHGWYFNTYHARKTVQQLGASCMYGHVHKPQLYTLEQRARGQMQGISVGCLCDLNPRYRRGQPTNWLHGFGYVEYRPSGEFQATSISIVNGAMVFGGEVWRG